MILFMDSFILELILVKELNKLIFMLLSVAFIILLERKLLALLQIRKGPSKIFFKGVLQPLSDFFKLFDKKLYLKGQGVYLVFMWLTPLFLLIIFFFFFCVLPLKTDFNPSMVLFWFFLCLGFNSYPIIFAGWYTNCKYSFISCYRSLGQMISYELLMMIYMISIVMLTKDLNLSKPYFINLLLMLPLISMPLIISILMELNRTPFDFSESESELVSGYMTEYGGFLFSFFFLCEYGMILFFSMFISFFLLFNFFYVFLLIMSIILIRSILPRTRYDKQMKLAWKIFLPLGVCLSFMSSMFML